MADGEPSLRAAGASGGVRTRVHNEGGEQFIVLPDAFRFACDEVSLRMVQGCVVIESAEASVPPSSDAEWSDFWNRIDCLRGDSVLELAPDEGVGEPDARV